MNIKYKLTTLVILGVLLEGCGGSSAPASNSVKIANKTTPVIPNGGYKAYSVVKGHTNWFDGVYTIETVASDVTKTLSTEKENFPGEKKTLSLPIYVSISEDNFYLTKKDTSRFSEKVDFLTVQNERKFTVEGTKDSILEVRNLAVIDKSQITITGAKLILNSGAIKEGSTLSATNKDSIVFKKETNQTNRFAVDGTFDANLTVPEGLQLSGHGKITGDLINDGEISLKGKTLTVGSFINRGTITVNLENAQQNNPLLVSEKAIQLAGKLKVLNGTVNQTYTLLHSKDKITGKLTMVDSDSISPIFKDGDKDYKVKVDKVVKTFSFSPSVAKSVLNHGLSTLSNASSHFMDSARLGVNLMQNAEKMTLGGGMSVTTTSKEKENFFAFNAGNTGMYVNYENASNMDFGAYISNSIGDFNLLSSIQFGLGNTFSNAHGAGSIDKSFFQITSELGRSFHFDGLTITPKITAGISDFLSLDGNLQIGEDAFFIEGKSKTSFAAGFGVDMTSKFKIAAIAMETFASFGVTNSTGHGITMSNGDQTITSASGMAAFCTLGFNAQIEKNSDVYGNLKLTSTNEKSFEFGLKIKM